jgi:membrane-associated phospholipid phosphatase
MPHLRLRHLVGLACALALAAPSAPAAASGSAAPVTDWIDVTLREISSHRTNPPRAARALGLVSVALDRAARRDLPSLHGAAAAVLSYLYPDHASTFEARAAALAESEAALRRGHEIGAAVVRRGQSDNSDAVYSGTRLSGLGYWTEPPGVAGPLEPAAGQWKPWNLPSGSALRRGPPLGPADGQAYAEQIQAVHDVSIALTSEQRALALFWADGAGTETPPGHWNRIAIGLIDASHLSPVAAARLLAVLGTAQADAFIACWDTKFTYWSERPNQAIRREIDPAWTSLIGTPPFPSYPSGHSSTSGAASTVLAAAFPSHARELDALARQAAISRLYGGIHFPMDNAVGLDLGRAVGARALAAYAGR